MARSRIALVQLPAAWILCPWNYATIKRYGSNFRIFKPAGQKRSPRREMKALLTWLDQRTGCRKVVHEALYENVPGGARWRYVWGSTLTFALAVQFITGIFLWMAYSPSSQTAWESVYYIQDEMRGGWLLRGLHHYMAQAMT